MVFHIIVETPAFDGVPLSRFYYLEQQPVSWDEFIILIDWVVESEEACYAIHDFWRQAFPDHYVISHWNEID